MTPKEQEEFLRYQRDAIRQMREMNQHRGGEPTGKMPPVPPFVRVSEESAPKSSDTPEIPPTAAVPPPPEETPHLHSAPQTPTHGTDDPFAELPLLRRLKTDGDMTLILGLICLLWNENTDRYLLLALLYLLL